MFSKSTSLITDYLIETDNFDPEHCKSLLQRSLKKKGEEVIASIDGYKIEPAQKERMVVVKAHLDYIEKSIEMMDMGIDRLVEPYETQISLLCSIPSVGTSCPRCREIDRFSCYKNKYERISQRRGKKRAIIAIARMILTAVYFMFKTGEVWNPSQLIQS